MLQLNLSLSMCSKECICQNQKFVKIPLTKLHHFLWRFILYSLFSFYFSKFSLLNFVIVEKPLYKLSFAGLSYTNMNVLSPPPPPKKNNLNKVMLLSFTFSYPIQTYLYLMLLSFQHRGLKCYKNLWRASLKRKQ